MILTADRCDGAACTGAVVGAGAVTSRREQVIFEDIMRWLYSLHLRAPGSTAMLVANHCDGMGVGDLESASVGSTTNGEDFARTAGLVEEHVRKLLKEWRDRRGIHVDRQATGPRRAGCRQGAAGITLLSKVVKGQHT